MKQRTLKITKNTFNSKKVRFIWIIHKEADLLNNIKVVGTGEGKILQGTNKTPVESGIGKGVPSGDSSDLVSEGVLQGLQLDMSTRERKSIAKEF